MELSVYFKSIIDQDHASVVICNLQHEIIYMNPAAIANYKNYGGASLLGKSLMNCHNEQSKKRIEEILDWFSKDTANNIIFTSHNEKKNYDVYVVALRNENKELIGYYEKHEHRTLETSAPYSF